MKSSNQPLWSAVLVVLTLIGLQFSAIIPAHAQDNSCKIMAPDENDVWVIIYDTDAGGNRQGVLWEGRIKAGHTIPITSSNGLIWYEYTSDPNQPYDGDTQMGCYQGHTILVE